MADTPIKGSINDASLQSLILHLSSATDGTSFELTPLSQIQELLSSSNGWSPILSVVTDAERRVLQVSDWTGGTGTKPASPRYVSSSGLTTVLSDAVDIRGASGADGSGGGVTTFAALTDKATVDIPAINTPTATALTEAKARGNHTGVQAATTITEDSTHRFATDAEKAAWNAKQAALVSGTNIKTINGTSVLGSGNISISGGGTLEGQMALNFVTEFGAVGDGVTDNAAAFAAVAALANPAEYFLFMPGGTYATSETFNWNPRLTIIGTGIPQLMGGTTTYEQGTTIKSLSAGPLVQYINDARMPYAPGKIQCVHFDGDGIGTIGLDLEGVQKFYFEGLGFQNFTAGTGMKMRGCLVGEIKRCFFYLNLDGLDIDSKSYSGDGSMPSNFIHVTQCMFFNQNHVAISASGGLSMLIMRGNNFEHCGGTGVASGCLSYGGGYEGIGFIFSDNYIEVTDGFATVNIGSSTSDVTRYVFENNQWNAAGSALHDIYVNANGVNKQRISISNSLMRNAGGLTIDGDNASLVIFHSTIPARSIPPAVRVVEITDLGEVLINGAPIGASNAILQYSNSAFTALGLGSSDRALFYNTDAAKFQVWDGTDLNNITTTLYTPPTGGGTTTTDDFNRADSVISLGNTVTPGTPWPPPVSGTWGIASTKGYCVTETNTGSTTFEFQTYDVGMSDYTFTVDVNVNTAATGGLVFRYVDANNFLYLEKNNSGLTLYKNVAGTFTAVGSPIAATTVGVATTIQVVTSGTSISVTETGGGSISGTIPNFSTSTILGFTVISGAAFGGGVTFDNFSAIP